MYKIKIEYTTGNSFGSHSETDWLEWEWNNLDIVKENIEAIIEHNVFIYDMKGYSCKYNDDALEEAKKKFWFAGEEIKYSCHEYEITICLKADDGSLFKTYPFWNSDYFNKLNAVDVDLDLRREV